MKYIILSTGLGWTNDPVIEIDNINTNHPIICSTHRRPNEIMFFTISTVRTITKKFNKIFNSHNRYYTIKIIEDEI